jgi:hypothetical protein
MKIHAARARATVRGRLNSVASAFRRLRKTNSDRTLVDVGINHLEERARQFISRVRSRLEYASVDENGILIRTCNFQFRSRRNKNACLT